MQLVLPIDCMLIYCAFGASRMVLIVDEMPQMR